MRARRIAVVLAAALALLTPVAAHALHAGAAPRPGAAGAAGGGSPGLVLDASVGLVGGTATELAFDYPLGRQFQISKLDWDIEDVVVAGAQASVGGRRVRLNLGFWAALNEGSGMMVDRDWLYSDAFAAVIVPGDDNWTDESRHPDTTVDKGTIFDLNLTIRALEAGSFAVSGIVGVTSETWGWSARGGTFIYSVEGFRDTTGSFESGVEVITYEQRFTIPYAGVGMAWTAPAFRLEGHLLASPLVTASDRDYHALRDVHFDGEFSGGTFVGLGVGASWDFAPRWSARLGLEYQSIAEITGDVTQTGAEGTGTFGGGGGVALEVLMASLGIGCRF